MKKILTVLTIIILLASVVQIPASAAGNSIISFSNKTITIGDKVVVTIKINIDEPVYALNFFVDYDATKLSYPDKAGRIQENVGNADGKQNFTFQYTFTSIAVGTAAISVTDPTYGTIDFNNGDKTFTGASSTLTIKDAELPNNANLSALSVNTGTLAPNFNAGRTNYTVSVPYETETITLYTKLSDPKAKVAVSSNPTNLNVGANTIKVTVTAQNGGQKTYTVVVTRREVGVPENPYQTVISGKDYEIVTTIPETSFLQGFTLSSAEWNGNQVPVIRDKDSLFTVYYLREKETSEIAPYIYNADLKTFEALKHFISNSNLYIFTDFPEDVKLPDDYYSTYTQIGNYSVKVYMDSNTQMSDFAYAYCYSNGNFDLYRFDNKEGTIQRYPEIRLVEAQNADAPERDDFATRFAALSTNGKILLITMLIAAICVVVLIVFIIVMAFQKVYNKQEITTDPQDFSFDDVTIVGENDITSSNK